MNRPAEKLQRAGPADVLVVQLGGVEVILHEAWSAEAAIAHHLGGNAGHRDVARHVVYNNGTGGDLGVIAYGDIAPTMTLLPSVGWRLPPCLPVMPRVTPW